MSDHGLLARLEAMAREQCSDQEALGRLRRASRRANIPVDELAQLLVGKSASARTGRQ